MRAHDQCSIFSTGGKFCQDYGLLLELHALTLGEERKEKERREKEGGKGREKKGRKKEGRTYFIYDGSSSMFCTATVNFT